VTDVVVVLVVVVVVSVVVTAVALKDCPLRFGDTGATSLLIRRGVAGAGALPVLRTIERSGDAGGWMGAYTTISDGKGSSTDASTTSRGMSSALGALDEYEHAASEGSPDSV
jgi:hypothetical protein